MPPAPSNPLRDLFTMRATPAKRWPFGVKAGLSSGIVVGAGVVVGNLGAGLIGTLGTFTSRYGNNRPYLNRGVQLAVIAIALALMVAVGVWAAPVAWAGILAVSVASVAAVWLCNALAVGPPGAYMFVMACAAGIGVSASQLGPVRVGLLVLVGGTVAWLIQMAGALTDFRRPERSAVAAAGAAVAAFIEAIGTPDATAARRRAAATLQESWGVLVNYQPVHPRTGSELPRLRAANHALHVLFADALTTAADGGRPRPGAAQQARQLSTLELPPDTVASRDTDRIPLGRPPVASLLRQAVTPGSQIRYVMLRVAIAVPIAGTIAAWLGVGRAYWAMATAVLVLHQGFDWIRTLQRGTERLLGTWVGLGLAAIILLIHPQGFWLVLIVALLQFTIELLVVRNYTLAVVFITATALTIASGARRVDAGELLVSRGADTAIGCAVAIVVYLVAAHRQEASRLTDAISRTLDAVAVACANLTRGDAVSLTARTARRDLQLATIAMLDAYDAAAGGSAGQRKSAEPRREVVTATEDLAYRTIAACWAGDRNSDRLAETGSGTDVFDTAVLDSEAAALRAAI
jgi:Fusaric acid resistance protein-like